MGPGLLTKKGPPQRASSERLARKDVLIAQTPSYEEGEVLACVKGSLAMLAGCAAVTPAAALPRLCQTRV